MSVCQKFVKVHRVLPALLVCIHTCCQRTQSKEEPPPPPCYEQSAIFQSERNSELFIASVTTATIQMNAVTILAFPTAVMLIGAGSYHSDC